MAKHQNKTIDNLYNFSNPIDEHSREKINKQKMKEREKRIKQRNAKSKEQFDIDTETVIGMTNRNNQKVRQEEQRRISKKQAKILKRKKRIKRILKLLVLLMIIIGGGVFALVSPIFNINEIQVVNNNQIPTDTIVSLSQLQLGENLFKFSCNNAEEEIKTNPYIKNVKVQRKIPNKVVITIEERERKFNVEFLNGFAYIDNQGYILEISEQKLDLPVIQGISTQQEQIVEGNRLNEEDLVKLQTVIQIMSICKSYELDGKVSSIDITNKNDYVLYMESEKKEIHLGDDSNLSNKMLYVPAILEENKDKEGTIYLDGDLNNNFKPRFREKV